MIARGLTLLLILLASSASALDTEVKVLIVRAPLVAELQSENITNQTLAIDRLEDVWNQGPGSTPVSLSVVNTKNAQGNYVTAQLVGPIISGSDSLSTWGKLTSGDYNIDDLRNAAVADLVVVLAPNATY